MSAQLPKTQQANIEDNKKDNPLSAAQRLAESRERLRRHLTQGDGRHEARRRTAAARADGTSPSGIDLLRAMPVLGVIIDAVSAWWSNHPLRPAATLADSVVRDAVAPLTRKHPITVLIGAFIVGCTIAWLKPWRFLGKSTLFAGLFSQIISRAVTQMPWESMLGAFTSFARAHTSDAPEPVAENTTASMGSATAAPRAETGSGDAASSYMGRGGTPMARAKA
jgi:hypothetical protein